MDSQREPIDVLVCHSEQDRQWAQYLKRRLVQAGLAVHLSELLAGADIARQWDNLLGRSRNGVILVSDAPVDGAVYSAMIRLADTGRLRLIPVVLANAPMPAMLSRFQPVNLVGAQSEADFDRCLPDMLAAISGTRPEQPDAALLFDRIPEGPVTCTLRIDPGEVVLSSPVVTSTGRLSGALSVQRVDHVRTALQQRDLLPMDTRVSDAALLKGEVAATLRQLISLCERRGSLLRVGVVASQENPLRDVVWERLCLEGEETPLVLMRNVVLFRSVTDLGETVDPRIPGPLRILAVIASPDGAGQLLDYEHELATIIEQVDAARREKAYVRILNWGSAEAIRQALAEEDFHVLHLSCHGEPGRLVLEKPDGAVDYVTAEDFVRRVLIPGRTVPFVVLAGCSTALAGDAASAADQKALPSYAQTLLEHGVPAVLAMTSRVGDLYATELLARTYRQLAVEPHSPDPLVALSQARRDVETDWSALPGDDPRWEGKSEWATAAVFTRVRSLTLFDPHHSQPTRRQRQPRIDHDIASLEIGDFVGRRSEMRQLLRAISGRTATGILIHGIGGVGKSSLAAATLHELDADGWTVVTLHGPRSINDILHRIARVLRRSGVDPVAMEDLADQTLDWRERLGELKALVREGTKVVLLLDDPLGEPWVEGEAVPAGDKALLEFLDSWLDIGNGARIILTLRMPISVRQLRNPNRIMQLHLGQLSPAESAKLLWRLPYVYELERSERERAYRALGGHPRALEYLNAFLQSGSQTGTGASSARSGNRPHGEIVQRLERLLEVRGITDATRFIAETGRSIDDSLAETISTSSADVLLTELYHRLDHSPVTQRLLVAASVFRSPVDHDGLNWVLSDDRGPDPARVARLRELYDRLAQAGGGATLANLRMREEQRAQLNRDLLRAYPARHPELQQARDALLELSLLSPAKHEDGERFIVHRWTAGSLATLVPPDVLHAAHARAAAYYRWHDGLYGHDDLTDLREAHFHFCALGDLDAIVATAADLCAALHASGAYDEERAVCDETLSRLDPDAPQTAVFLHAKAIIAMLRGEYDTATALQQRCLELAERLQDRVTAATSRQQMGVIAQLRGDPALATASYRAAMRICFDVGLDGSPHAQAVVAACYQQLGALALQRGDPDDASRWSRGALDIVTELGEEMVLSTTDDDLARLARAMGDTALADEHALGSHELQATQPDIMRLAATASLQLGAVHVLNDRPQEAAQLLERAGDLARRLQDTPLLAKCLQLNGDVLFELHRYGEATEVYEAQRELLLQLEDVPALVVVYQQLGRVATACDDPWSEETLRTALNLAERLADPRLVGATHLYRGSAMTQRDPAGAREALVAGREAATQAGDQTLWVSCVLHLAAVESSQGNHDAAVGLADDALRRALLTGNESAVLACCHARGLMERQNGDDRTAAAWIIRARDRASEIVHRRAMADCDLHLARIAADGNDLELAETHYQRCLETADPDRHVDLAWHAWRELGHCRATHHQHESALPALRHALDLIAGSGQPEPELWCVVNLMWSQDRTGDAEAHASARRCAELADRVGYAPFAAVGLLCAGDGARDEGDSASARGYYERALALAADWGRQAAPQAVDAFWQLGRLAHAEGQAEVAAGHYVEAGQLAENLGDRLVVAHLLRELGRTQRDLGQAVHARELWESSLVAAQRLGDERLAAASRLLLADLDEAEGDSEQAATIRARLAEQFSKRGLAAQRAEYHHLYAAALSGLQELLWSRRLRIADGETPFVQPQATYIGPAIEDVVREMSPRASLVSGVPAAVAPHLRRPRHP